MWACRNLWTRLFTEHSIRVASLASLCSVSLSEILFTKSSVMPLCPKSRLSKAGDPLDEDTFIGPVISEDDAKRVESWVQEAVDEGATLLCGGKRFDRVFVSPAVVENVPRTAKLYAKRYSDPLFVWKSILISRRRC